MPLKPLVFTAALSLGFAALAATPASAGRYCTGSCDSYVVAPHVTQQPAYHPQIIVDEPRPLYTRRAVKRHVHKVRRAHRVRRSHVRRSHVRRIPRLAPQVGPVHMRGRTRFCSDHVVKRGHKLIRRCVQVRNDLLDRH